MNDIVRQEFSLKSAYLNSAYLGPTPKRARKKIQESLERTSDPSYFPYPQWFRISDQLRNQFGDLMGVPGEQVALSTSVSETVSLVANGAGLTEKDEVLLLEGDYPSMVLPWMLMAERKGIQVRRLPLETYLSPKKLLTEISSKTKWVCGSHVMFNTGFRLPWEEISEACAGCDVLTLVDVSQSFGGRPVPESILRHADVITGVGYKWLMGPYGSAFGYFSKRALEAVQHTHASWLVSPNSMSTDDLLRYTTETLAGARKYDRGQSPSFLISAGLEGSLGLLQECGLQNVARHNSELVEYFLANVPSSFRPNTSKELRSNIQCLKVSGDPQVLKAKLASAGVDVSVRQGSLRVSFHVFNTVEDVDRLLDALEGAER
ncbi:MAG: aminotransferase class V-fold PLP-dependent enzyme [Bdellovibrionales bacterium]